jgi:hypothetical protein
VIDFTAPASTLLAESTLQAGAPIVTFSAPSSTVFSELLLTAGTPFMTFTAPEAARLAETTLLTTVPEMVFSVPPSTLLLDWILAATAPVVTFTAPTAILSQAGGLFNYYTGLNAVDTNSAWRWALQDRYSVDNLDIAPLLARYLQEHTGNDSTRAYRKLEDICRGLQPPDA